MKPFEIYIAYIPWGTGGKNRPVLLLEEYTGLVAVYTITSRCETKSAAYEPNISKSKRLEISGT
jgi:hypothetical protein